MGAVVVDSSVLIAVIDTDDALRERVDKVMLGYHASHSKFLVPTTVLSEVLVAESRRDEPAVDHRRQLIYNLFGPTRVIDDDVAVAAAKLRAKHKSLRLPDALVIAVGIVDDANVVLTADKRWVDVDERIKLI